MSGERRLFFFPVAAKGQGASSSSDYEQYGFDANGNVTSFRTRRVVDISGAVFFQARYGSKPLDLGKGMTAVEVGKVDALPGVIDKLIEATNNGELDQALATAAADRKANFKRPAKAS